MRPASRNSLQSGFPYEHATNDPPIARGQCRVAADQIVLGAVAAGVAARERVPRGHKMALAGIREGEPVRKYGQTIGFASRPISPGDWVHEQNVALRDFARDYRFAEARYFRRLSAAKRKTRHTQ